MTFTTLFTTLIITSTTEANLNSPDIGFHVIRPFFVINISGFFSCYSESSGTPGSTSNSFIFSLRNKESLPPFKSMVTNPSRAIYRYSDYGPTFGGGHDIHIADNASSNSKSYTNFKYSYSVPSGVQSRTTILAGTFHFTPDDWEVFFLG